MAKRIYNIPKFNYYALADSIYAILQETESGIKTLIKPNVKTKQTQQLMMAEILY